MISIQNQTRFQNSKLNSPAVTSYSLKKKMENSAFPVVHLTNSYSNNGK